MTLEPLVVSRLILTSAAVLACACAAWDARAFRIPNAYALGIALLFPLYTFVAPQPLPWGSALLCAALVFLGGLFLYRHKGMGAGDVKFLSALALWAGTDRLAVLLIVTALAGGALSVAFALSALGRARGKGAALKTALHTRIPYGIAIAIGGLCVFYTRLLAG